MTLYVCPKCREQVYPNTTLAKPNHIQIRCGLCGRYTAYTLEEWQLQKKHYEVGTH